MYRVKRGKKTGVCIVTPDILAEIEEERNRGLIVRRAIAQSGLFLSFQPIIELANGSLSGAEGLMRLKQDSGEIWTASEFIKTLEKLSLMPTVDQWVIENIVSQLSSRWQSLVNAGLTISVNVTPSTLSSPGFAARTLDKLDKAGIPSTLLGIELLESDLSPVGTSPFLDNLTMLSDEGVKIAIDDFGTGYSNLRYLATLPINSVKVAKTLIDLAGQKSNRADSLLKAVVSTAKSLDFIIIAEGIEDAEKSAFLKSIGFDRAQGYFYGKELTLDELTQHSSTR